MPLQLFIRLPVRYLLCLQVRVDLGSPSPLLDSWLTGSPCDGTWAGVTCSGGVVVGLSITGSSLSVPAPTSLMYVPTLVSLNLASAGLTGTLPPAWSVLGALTELQVQTNQLAGSLPAAWSALNSLVRLNLGSNQLTATVPSAWASGIPHSRAWC